MLCKRFKLATTLLFFSYATQASSLSVEELRIEKAVEKMPKVFTVFNHNLSDFEKSWKQTTNYQHAKEMVVKQSQQLWLDSTKQLQSAKTLDDRPLYWARLNASKIMRSLQPAFNISTKERQVLIDLFEQGSRGRTDLEYKQKADKKILLTGFDPFLLDQNINQSNPSGIAALLLDGVIIEHNGITAEINTVMVPVRYKDFDDGTIESLLAPYYALNNVDMVVTVSMGRKEFDLERFPGKRRSASAPDNLNIYSGGTRNKPVMSRLHNRELPGEEFVEFSLPIEQMQKAKGPYSIIDNHKVTSIANSGKAIDFKPYTLSQLNGHLAVNGSGGGYLSNEISYRSIRLRDQLDSTIPTGHIHTPRIQQFEPETEAKIVKQIKAMLEQALVAL